MTPWHDVLATALIGTDRRAAATPAALLDEAATWAPYRRAGFRPVSGVDRPAPAPAEARPVVRPGAARRLARLLESGAGLLDAATRELVLAEWLDLATRHGWRVAPHQLPQLLDFGRARRDLRPAIGRVGGERARWLAGQNPAWRYLLGTASVPDESLWTEGDQAQRLGFFRARRSSDPAAARALLEEDWRRLAAEERVELVAALADGLAAEDEPLLEAALDDRRRETRAAAVSLLRRLPNSAHQQRCAERAWACLRPDGGVEPPAECDRAMQRDGVNPKPPRGTGERAFWLEQVLELAPLGTWPDDLLDRGLPEEWVPLVHAALARAASVQRRPDWARRVLDRLTDKAPPYVRPTLYGALDPEVLIDRALAALAARETREWAALLGHCPPPWPERLGRAVLEGLPHLAALPGMAGETLQISRLAAVRVPVNLASRAISLATQFDRLGGLADVLRFRYQMTEELQP